MQPRAVLWAGLAAGAFMGGAACRQRPAIASQAVRPIYDAKTGVLNKLEADSDHDGRFDTWAYMEGTRVVRVEVDENGDGKVDRWEIHSREPGGQPSTQPPIERIERATRHDGIVSRWEYFEKGSLARVEEDTDGDGKVDKWETYSGGNLAMMAIDTQHRGNPDRRLIYRANGTLDRIEGDPTGSGNFQPLPQPRGK